MCQIGERRNIYIDWGGFTCVKEKSIVHID